MINLADQKGFSLFELMIAVAVVGLLSAVAIPAYRGYIDTANMTKVTATFEESVRLVTNTYARRKARAALGIVEVIPATTEEWILILNPNNLTAPGGGPAFIPSTNKSGQKGDAITGAIGVRWSASTPAKTRKNGSVRPAKDSQMELWRPLYSGLVGQRVIIKQDSLEIKKFKK
jgi:prepilin-type N-terminal cleavage/methylation domain-containing protein